MKIAVTYENGSVFQHFGHTEQFKLYDVAGGKVVSSQVVDTNGSGHGALATLLGSIGVDTLICGGIGGGAQVQTDASDAASQALLTAPMTGCYLSGVGDASGNAVDVAYAAIVTPLSQAVTNATVANVVFVVEWDT